MEKKPKFQTDNGIHRSTAIEFNRDAVEKLVKEANNAIKRRGKPVKLPLKEVEEAIGTTIGCANNLSWEFSQRNPRGRLRDLAEKYRVKVGSHYGAKQDKNKRYMKEKMFVSFKEDKE